MDINELLAGYKQIVIFDTEYTTWLGAKEKEWSGSDEHRELVQLAAAKINLETKSIIDAVEIIVKLTKNPILSDYFMELTGVTQARVDAEGISFAQAYEKFIDWTGGVTCFSYANSQKPLADGHILEENIILNNMTEIVSSDQFKNIRPIFDAAGVPTHLYNSGKLYEYFDIKLEGHEHNAMHDVMSLSHSLFALY